MFYNQNLENDNLEKDFFEEDILVIEGFSSGILSKLKKESEIEESLFIIE